MHDVGWAEGLNVPALGYANILIIDTELIMMLNGGWTTNRTTVVIVASVPFNKVRQRAGLVAVAVQTLTT